MADDFKEERTAKFNSGIAKLIRMGKLREGCHDARAIKDYQRWFSFLLGWRSEINSKLTQPNEVSKEKEGKCERETCDTYQANAKSYLFKAKDGIFSFNGKETSVSSFEIYDYLYEYELYLGDLEEKYKLGMPDSDGEDDL